jgi:uncharacterized protein YsxB (DUF464 family)
MIRSQIFTSPTGEMAGFRITGHAGGIAGNDIVCAAVSSAAYLTVNTITDVLFVNAQVSVDEEAGMLFCLVPKDGAERCQPLLKGFAMHMQALEESYPKCIQVDHMEV